MDSFRVTVKSVKSSRYPVGVGRPENWDDRVSGVETIITECGKTISIYCDGQQSTPQPGWVILVDSKSQREDGSVGWTLFGLPKGSVPAIC